MTISQGEGAAGPIEPLPDGVDEQYWYLIASEGGDEDFVVTQLGRQIEMSRLRAQIVSGEEVTSDWEASKRRLALNAISMTEANLSHQFGKAVEARDKRLASILDEIRALYRVIQDKETDDPEVLWEHYQSLVSMIEIYRAMVQHS